jgi:hypothetical protein
MEIKIIAVTVVQLNDSIKGITLVCLNCKRKGTDIQVLN